MLEAMVGNDLKGISSGVNPSCPNNIYICHLCSLCNLCLECNLSQIFLVLTFVTADSSCAASSMDNVLLVQYANISAVDREM